LATVNIDTTAPDISAVNPSGSKSVPTHFDPDTTVTLEMTSWREKVSNPRVVVGGSTKSLSFDRSVATPYGTEYHYTAPWDTSGHSGEKLSFTFKAEDDVGNTGSDTAYALIGSYADGYFTMNGKKVSKGATISLGTRSITLKATVTTDEKPDEVWYIVKVVDVSGYNKGEFLKKKSDTVKTSSPYEWSYTFPKDGTYKVCGYFRSYGKNVQVMSVDAGINSSPIPVKMPNESIILAGIGAFLTCIGAVARFRPETF